MTRSRVVVFLLCLYPLGFWLAQGFIGGLTANPPEYLTRSSGEWALVGLCLVLAAPPAQRWFGVTWPLRHRRMLGLFTYFYTVLHVLAWALWEQGWSLSAMWVDIVTRLFITVGVVAVVLLTPLAITSTNAWVRRLGRNWRRLHWLVYPAVALSIWHFWLVRAGKNDFADVWVYVVVFAVLLVTRVLAIKNTGAGRRRL
ncbi:sulfite oxidase heme-binding subunit YedZ [Pusillimonas minor]|uniref:Protein-methionine-sulfoxide reductase heme-binding subunit MsrQ n=1 Tax=Pusillimonas minor TaxID=2697024 RepID=A0A842HLQ1_9BURK|nr:protein-methionine-sulfoxide reductase heme-binding subunit MsrQ [Pusillimonas minor]MBC2768682.1 sulfoxide reductase heme-binding subunit YedZ [Pusillimonas minor]